VAASLGSQVRQAEDEMISHHLLQKTSRVSLLLGSVWRGPQQ